jgi:hypothetical protein
MPAVTFEPDGSVVIGPLGHWHVETLVGLPELLAKEQPDAVLERLFPRASEGDESLNREWERLVVPELVALLASARELVVKDLEGLEPIDPPGGSEWRLRIPEKHRNAWINALQAARLTLSERFGIAEEDMERPLEKIRNERDLALWKVHELGWLQGSLIEGGGES